MISVRVQSRRHRVDDGSERETLGALSFELRAGETVALLGRSGIGKTTLLHIIAGLDRSFSGEVTGDISRCGFVFQAPRLLPWRTALQNLSIAAPEADEAFLLKLLDDVGVPEVAGLYPGQLSLGMARRVALARALAIRPSLLLLDEPFASLDIETSARLRDLLQNILSQADIPAILVTHDPAEALGLADRVLVLGGRPAVLRMDRSSDSVTVEELAASIADQQAG